MFYVWLFLGALGVICGVTLSMIALVRTELKSQPMSSPVFPVGGLVLTAAYFLISLPLWLEYNLAPALVMLGAFCSLFFLQLRLSGIWKEIGFLIVSLVSVLMLPMSWPLFQQLGVIWVYLILAAALYLMMRLFVIMDRVPWFSLLTLLAQGLLIILFLKQGILPPEISYFLFFAFVSTIAVAQTVKVYFGEPVLGDFASVIAGFLLGYLWTIVIAQGYWSVPPILYSYSAVEILISCGCCCVVTRRLCPPNKPFFIEEAFATGINPKKLVRFVFFMLVLFSGVACVNLSSQTWVSVVIVLVLALFATCAQLKRWAVPRVRFRDLGSDLKQGFSELKKEMMNIPLKDKTPKKKRKRK